MSFLKYTGVSYKISGVKKYEFEMLDENNLTEYSLVELPSPIYDNSFKNIFGTEEEITKAMLNSFMYPSDERIIKVEFMRTNIPGSIGELHSLGSIIADVLCKCVIDEGNGKKKELIVDLEMQIEFSSENTKRFISYLKKLNKFYSDYRIIVVALVFRGVKTPQKNMGTKTLIEQIELLKKNKIEVNTFDEFPIYQIDISYCYKEIFCDKKDISIFPGQIIREKGKEWIKFLNLPNWCEFFRDDLYAFPPISSILYEDKEVKHALNILSGQNDPRYEQFLEDQKKLEEKEKLFKQMQKQIDMLTNQNNVLKENNKELKKENKELKKKGK